jgi:hypothetical protein
MHKIVYLFNVDFLNFLAVHSLELQSSRFDMNLDSSLQTITDIFQTSHLLGLTPLQRLLLNPNRAPKFQLFHPALIILHN